MPRRVLALIACCLLPWMAAAAGAPLTVYAAASLSDALQDCANHYTAATGVPVRLSFAASSALARQIEAGAAADAFIAADTDWMDYLAERHLINPSSRRDLLSNRLVLIAGATDTLQLPISAGFAAGLVRALGTDRLALADPDSVPAGRYAHAALTALHAWDDVAMHLARAENVRAALQYVARGETRLGIVYETDARADARVRVVAVFPDGSHAPIRYPMAATATASPLTAAFLDYLASPSVADIWIKYGFRRP
jgi:molybdate transport system substrate-binding protein